MEPDPAELERLSEMLRAAGCRVAAVSRPHAVLALTRAFDPDAAVIGVHGPAMEGLRLGKQLDRRFKGTVPMLYLGDAEVSPVRRHFFGRGKALSILPREAAREELLASLRAALAFRNAVAKPLDRASLVERVTAEVRRGERWGGSFSVGIVELDDFLGLRQRLGEDGCDLLMVQAAAVLKNSLRELDLVARVGKYHFGILLPGLPAEAVGALLAQVARGFHQAEFHLLGERVCPAVTVGTASFPDVVGPAEELFARAIQDLDRARGEGRSRVMEERGDGAESHSDRG